MDLKCDYLFHALDDELDVRSFLRINPEKQYNVYDYDVKDQKKFKRDSAEYLHIFDKLFEKYKPCLTNNVRAALYRPFVDSFKKFCNEDIERIIADKIIVDTKQFRHQVEDKHHGFYQIKNIGNRKIIVIDIKPVCISFIILFDEKKGVQFAFGIHCGHIIVASQQFLYINWDPVEEEDLFLGMKLIQKIH